MSDLPPFSGDDPTCPKCGNIGARTAYWPSGEQVNWGGVITPFGSERLHRECRRCDYAWDEATVDRLYGVHLENATVEQQEEATGCRCADLSHSLSRPLCQARAERPDGLCEDCHQNAVARRPCVTKETEPLRDDGSCGCCGALPTECVCPGECVCPCPPGKDRNW